MKNVLNLLFAIVFVLACLHFSSCGGDPDPLPPLGAEGFYIVNEGTFNGNNASLSFYDRGTGTVTNDVFQTKNDRPLGDQAQSMTVWDGKGYIVVQNSGKVEVVDASDNSSITTITRGIESPRYFVGVSSTKGYLSDWGTNGTNGSVKVIDLTTLTVTRSISTGQGPNKLLVVGNSLFVPNSGGFLLDNKVTVIDINTDQIIKTINVADNPNSIQMDKEGNLWIACGGNLLYNEDFSIDSVHSSVGMLWRLDPALTAINVFVFGKFSFDRLANLEINPAHDMLYYTYNGAVYEQAILSAITPTHPFINKPSYGLAVDPFNGDVMATLAPNFTSAGKIEVYSREGEFKSDYVVGIAPNGCAFK